MTAEECLELLDDPLTNEDFSIRLWMGRWELRDSHALGSDYLIGEIGEYDHLREVAETIRRLRKAEKL